MRGARGVRDLALRTGAPTALLRFRSPAGPLLLEWANPAMRGVLGLDDSGTPVPLAELLTEASRGRLARAAGDLAAIGGQTASVEVTTVARGKNVWFHLLAPSRPSSIGLRWTRRGRRRHLVLHAHPAAPPRGVVRDPAENDREALVERLAAALVRLRRHPSRVAIAVARVGFQQEGTGRPSLRTQAELAHRIRLAARETDASAELGPGSFAVLTEDPAGDGGVAVAERVLAVLRRPLHSGARLAVTVTRLEITDPRTDPEVVLDWLEERSAHRQGQEGVITLSPPELGDQRPSARTPGAHEPSSVQERIETALDSGRFVLGLRTALTLGGAPLENQPGGAATSPGVAVVEVGTVDDDVVEPVRVDAPGLAAELDRWALRQLARPDAAVPCSQVVLRLQPVGSLTALTEDLRELRRRRPDLRISLQIPEARLDEAVTAEQALLNRLPELGVALAVADWTGRLGVRALLTSGVDVVELAPLWHDEVLRSTGAAMVTALTAGLRVGRGTGALVAADRLPEAPVAAALAVCGVGAAFSDPALLVHTA